MLCEGFPGRQVRRVTCGKLAIGVGVGHDS
jgi:hypothetical protein